MEEVERAQERLQHIRSVEPILGALRMVALGSWQKARKRQAVSQQYGDRLLKMLPHLLPHLPRRLPHAQTEASPTRRVVVVVGSERGMCGRFNVDVVAYADNYLADREKQGETITLATLGSRVNRILVAGERTPSWSRTLPATSLPPLPLAFSLTRQWLEQSVRYQVLESAMQNVERLIDELSGVVQVARQQAITREMQALAVGAGLVGAPEVE